MLHATMGKFLKIFTELQFKFMLTTDHQNETPDHARTHLFVSFKNMTPKDRARITRNIAEYLQVLRIMRDVEYSEKSTNNRTR